MDSSGSLLPKEEVFINFSSIQKHLDDSENGDGCCPSGNEDCEFATSIEDNETMATQYNQTCTEPMNSTQFQPGNSSTQELFIESVVTVLGDGGEEFQEDDMNETQSTKETVCYSYPDLMDSDIPVDDNSDPPNDRTKAKTKIMKRKMNPHILVANQTEGLGVETSQSFDDYMDVVTTYKCKFCRFSCNWKSGLMSHLRSCHFESQGDSTYSLCIPQKDSNLIGSDADFLPETTNKEQCNVQNGKGIKSNMQEQHIFLCGECSRGFNSLHLCKEHMIQDHKFYLNGALNKDKKLAKRAVLKPKRNVKDTPSSDNLVKDMMSSEPGLKVKPAAKTPRPLQVDFLLESRKRRDKPYRCNEPGCGCRFSSEKNLEYHFQCHLSDEKPFVCPECRESFDQWRRLLMHLWKEHLVDLDLYTCEECGYKSCSQFKLETHQKIHSEAREFACTECDKRFKQPSQLRNHSVVHMDRNQKTGDLKRWYSTQECDVCNRTFSDSKCLRKHQQAVHSKLKPYVCTFCNHTSARKAMLLLHMRQHTGEKPFTCEHCEYKTGDHNSLRRHRMRHTGSKPYKCAHCAYACIQAISLKTHLKNKHPGLEGLYACRLCGFRSVSKDNFTNHMSDHKRGAIPITATNDKTPDNNIEAPQLHLPDGSVQQLDSMLPGNMISAQLICSCLNALGHDGDAIDLPPGVLTAAEDGTQTITIQIPANADQETGEQYYFTIQRDVIADAINVTDLADAKSMNISSNYITNETLANVDDLQEGNC